MRWLWKALRSQSGQIVPQNEITRQYPWKIFWFSFKNLCSKAFLAGNLIVLTVVWFQMLRTCEGKSKNCSIKLCGTLWVARLLVFSNGEQYVACGPAEPLYNTGCAPAGLLWITLGRKVKKTTTLNKVDKNIMIFFLCSFFVELRTKVQVCCN